MRRALASTAAALVVGAMPALAADFDGPPVPPAPRFAPARPVEPAFVQAARPGGLYLGSVTGANFVERTRSRFDALGPNLALRTDYEAAAYAAGRIGYAFDPMFGILHPRADVEVGYATNSVERYRIGPLATARIDSFGEARAIQGYGNLYVDMDLGFGVKPYVGGGVGVANVHLRRQGVSATGVIIDSSDTGFAYHLDAGIGMDLSRFGSSVIFTGTTVELGYRWTQVPDLRFQARDGSGIKSEYQSQMITLGTRKAF